VNLINNSPVNYIRGFCLGATACLVQDAIVGSIRSKDDLIVSLFQKVVICAALKSLSRLPIISEIQNKFTDMHSAHSWMIGAAAATLLSIGQSVLLGKIRSKDELVIDVAIKCVLLAVCNDLSLLPKAAKLIKVGVCKIADTSKNVIILTASKTTDIFSEGISYLMRHREVSGITLGLLAGSIVNFLQNQSFSSRSMIDCIRFSYLPVLGEINDLRESYALLWSWIMLPTMAFALSNAERRRQESGSLCNSFLAIKPVLTTVLASSSVLLGGLYLRQTVAPYIPSVDISGHVVKAVVQNYFCTALLRQTEQTFEPSQNSIIKGAVIIRSMTDLPWTFNTAAYCHTIADVVSAVAIGLFVVGSLHVVSKIALNVGNRCRAWL
jgi:hypothetical protein